MGLGILALAALEIAVGGRGNPLAVHRLVVVHRHAHRATSVTPLETGIKKDAVEPFLFGLVLDMTGARDHHRSDPYGDLAAPSNCCGGAEVLDPAVGE